MCGIIGVFGTRRAEDLVRTSLTSLPGRGADGERIVLPDKTSALGHRLHAIVGHVSQPLQGTGLLATNCEIYNWKELALQHHVTAKNDADVLLQLLDKTQDRLIPRILESLDGDYACIYHRKNKVWFARDPFGVKPLWFSQEQSFALTSERKMLLSCVRSETSIRELHPRHICCYDRKTHKIKTIVRSWPVVSTPHTSPSMSHMPQHFEQSLLTAVKKRLPAPHQPLGILFSGGVDSTVLAMLVKHLGHPVTVYTTIIEDSRIGIAKDLLQSQRAATALALPHHIIRISLQELEQALPDIIRTIDSCDVVKVAASIPTYFAAKQAASDGMRVLLSGMGADDILSGYARQQSNADLVPDLISNVRRLFERDTYREDTSCMRWNIEGRYPYLDSHVLTAALAMSRDQVRAGGNKSILRSIGMSLGYTDPALYPVKSAAQYGSRADTALEHLAKQHGFGERKAAYLSSLTTQQNARCVALVSGGKDSLLALLIQHRKQYPMTCLLTMVSKNPDSYMFHTPNTHVVKLQATALGIPLVNVRTIGVKEAELQDLKRGLRLAIRKYAVEGIVVGAIASTYQRDRIERLAEELGLKVYAPLWHKDQRLVLQELLTQGFEVILTKVAAEGLDTSWLGTIINQEHLNRLLQLQQKIGLSVAGEGGEYESLVLDMPLFKQKIRVVAQDVVRDGIAAELRITKAMLVKKNKREKQTQR